MSKIKLSIAVALVNPDNEKQVLAVKRPDEDRLGNVWGLPAVTIEGVESPEQGVVRIGREKLDTEIASVELIGTKRSSDYKYVLMEFKAQLIGKQPNVTTAPVHLSHTRYIEQKWTDDWTLFIPAARKGSLCSRILLESKGINWKD